MLELINSPDTVYQIYRGTDDGNCIQAPGTVIRLRAAARAEPSGADAGWVLKVGDLIFLTKC